MYIGQTGRCFADRVLEHERTIKGRAAKSLLWRHLEECSNCAPVWDACRLLGKERETYKRMVLETTHICCARNRTSAPSLAFDEIEILFL